MQLSLASSQLGVRVSAIMTGFVANRGPQPDFALAPTAECNVHGGARIAVDGSNSTDPDGTDGTDDIVSYQWFVDGLPGGRGATHTILVPLGTHEVMLRVKDKADHIVDRIRTVTVSDSTPPSIADFVYTGPVCLWPPNHDYAVLELARDFSALVSDACDPTPTFTINEASSDQPDDGLGDGTTQGDVVLHPDRVCLRTERSGNVLAGRAYSVHLVATDAHGNSADPVVTIRVPHDASEGGCARMKVQEGVGQDSPRCQPAVASPVTETDSGPQHAESSAAAQAQTDDGQAGGCSAVRGAFSPVLLIALGAWLRRRSARYSRSR